MVVCSSTLVKMDGLSGQLQFMGIKQTSYISQHGASMISITNRGPGEWIGTPRRSGRAHFLGQERPRQDAHYGVQRSICGEIFEEK